MKEPPDLGELVGSDVPPAEMERLQEVDALLRKVPAPPHDVPASLTQSVAAVPLAGRPGRRAQKFGLALAFAALIAVVSFGIGHWSGSSFETDYAVDMAPTANAPGAEAVVKVGNRDEETGNVALLVDVSGLPPVEKGYALWLEKDGEWAATCGYFAVGEGTTTVRMTVAYDFREFDAWAISVADFQANPPPLLAADIPDI